ncbi:MAG TPA: isoprenylcysteine carboxylmethyltransferase family protein [Vicinamibacterales bacterium]|jgi:protein-S-isoprenylcysteine O-methyltransferase Ste14
MFVWPYALPFWVAYAWAFLPEGLIVARGARDNRARSQSQDKGSMGVIVCGGWLGLAAAFAVAKITRFAFPEPARFDLYWAGIVLLILGSLLRRHCWRMLGEHFTGNVVARADQVVVQRGAYKYVRHPSYTAGTMMFTAIGLSLGSWLSTIIAFGSAVAVYLYRVNVEERALAAAIGERYVRFMKSRKRFIPFIY